MSSALQQVFERTNECAAVFKRKHARLVERFGNVKTPAFWSALLYPTRGHARERLGWGSSLRVLGRAACRLPPRFLKKLSDDWIVTCGPHAVWIRGARQTRPTAVRAT